MLDNSSSNRKRAASFSVACRRSPSSPASNINGIATTARIIWTAIKLSTGVSVANGRRPAAVS